MLSAQNLRSVLYNRTHRDIPEFLTSRLKRGGSEDLPTVHPLTWCLLSPTHLWRNFLPQGSDQSPACWSLPSHAQHQHGHVIRTMHTLEWDNLEAPIFANTANIGGQHTSVEFSASGA